MQWQGGGGGWGAPQPWQHAPYPPNSQPYYPPSQPAYPPAYAYGAPPASWYDPTTQPQQNYEHSNRNRPSSRERTEKKELSPEKMLALLSRLDKATLDIAAERTAIKSRRKTVSSSRSGNRDRPTQFPAEIPAS
eukprot:3139009-Rhodomonas_salina.1